MKRLFGLWWTREAPDEKLAGLLTLPDGRGPRLDVVTDVGEKPKGSLAALLQPSNRVGEMAKNLVVHGYAKGEPFTLCDGFLPGLDQGHASLITAFYKHGAPGKELRVAIDFDRGFRGAHIEEPSELNVNAIYLRCPGMDAWLSASPFTVALQERGRAVSITHRIPDDQSYQIDDERKFIVTWVRNGPSQSIVQTRIDMNVMPWFGIEYSKTVSPAQASEDATSVAQLLSMLLGAPTTPDRIEMTSPKHTRHIGESEHEITLQLLAGYFTTPTSFDDWTPFDVLLTFCSLEHQFETVLKRWFKLRQECWGMLVPYVVSQRSPSPIAERQFFNFAATAESIHSHFSPEEIAYPETEAREIRKNVMVCIPKARRQAVRHALQWINALTYAERLERLWARFPQLAGDVVGDKADQNLFNKTVKTVRHTEAHRKNRDRENDEGGLKITRISGKLKVIIDAWILAELGISESVIEQAMRKNRRYWFRASAKTSPWNV